MVCLLVTSGRGWYVGLSKYAQAANYVVVVYSLCLGSGQMDVLGNAQQHSFGVWRSLDAEWGVIAQSQLAKVALDV